MSYDKEAARPTEPEHDPDVDLTEVEKAQAV